MASTSSASQRPSSSANSKWRYDVFLSFRGKDTRNSFTDHLYWALDRGSIKTFRDDEELPRGEDISHQILKAIEESRIAIIVFSKTYADSKWCLDELVKIIECEKEKGQKVFPIFYHVEPSEVRNQTGIYGEAFNSHETNADDEKKKKKIEEWKAALRKAGQLSGFPLKDGSESKFIEEIIGEISRLIPTLVHVGENIVGIDEKLEQVKLLINEKSHEVSMVGIYGIGGIGKTTIAKVTYNDMLDQFKHHSFLENVRERSKDDHGLLQLQEKLLCDILMEKNLKLRNVDEGIEMIKSKCHLEKVLFVLDDVDCPRKLKFLAGSSEWFCRGSIIIVTTRYKRCLDVHKAYSSYEAKGLEENKALELFSWNAFQQPHPRDNYADLCNCVLHYAKGLPLALVVLGSFLFQRDEDEWESTLRRLKTIPLEDIQKTLQISYDGLDDKCKKLFLHIACFFKNCSEKIVTRILEGCKFHPKIELKVLDERCLISISHGVIRMHDLLQEMGWAIVREEHPGNPGKWSRLWEYNDIKSVLTKDLGTKDIEGIFLNETIVEHIQLPAEAFKNMNQLRLLKFGSNTVQLSQDFELPCHELTYLDWNGYSLKSMPSNFHADNLVELHLQWSSIRHLWEGNMKVGMLKILNLSYSEQLVDISSISSAPNLEFLILEGCISLKSLPTNLHEFKHLQTLSCARCYGIKSFPGIGVNMRRLRELDFSRTGIIEVPSSIRHLHGLEYLDLGCCQNLLSLPDSICSLSSLKTLRVNDCPIKSFPKIGENMDMLRELNFSGTDIIEIPSSIRHLHGLEILDLSCCRNLLSLPGIICSLSSLQTLRVTNCPIKNFPEIGENMGGLRALDLRKTGIIEVPSSIRHLHGLEYLNLSYCQNLLSLPNSICSLSSLKTLMVEDCPELKPIFMKLKVCSSPFKCLNLTYRIVKPGVIVWENNCFFSLNALNPWCDQREEEILNHTYPLSSLVQLCISKSDVGGIGNDSFHPSSLRISCQTNYHGMDGKIPSDIFHQPSLEKLSLRNFNFKEAGIPLDNWYLPSLQSLSLRYCNLMEGEVLNHVCHLSSLRKLDLQGSHFSSIPAGISRLFDLRVLKLSHCEYLQQIPELPSSLRFLDACCSDHISSSSSFLQFPSLIDWFKSALLNQDSCISVDDCLSNELGVDDCSSDDSGFDDCLYDDPVLSIAIPRSSGILEGISYQSTGSKKVTIQLSPNWYENNDLLGFSVYCVCTECGLSSQRYKCDLRIRKNFDVSDLGSALLCSSCLDVDASDFDESDLGSDLYSSSCVDSDISDIAWIMCYPKVAIKEKYRSNQWTHLVASFHGVKRVEGCGIHLIYAKDDEQMHPSMLQACSSSHGNSGDHGSPTTEDDYSKAQNKRSLTEQSPVDESHHRRFRGTQD